MKLQCNKSNQTYLDIENINKHLQIKNKFISKDIPTDALLGIYVT